MPFKANGCTKVFMSKRSFEKRAKGGDGAKRRGKGGHRSARQKNDAGGPVYLYGTHSVEAALLNPKREIIDLWVTRNAAQRLSDAIAKSGVLPHEVMPQELDRMLDKDAVHQGAILKTTPLPAASLEDLPNEGLCLALDQVTDPHNVGAILRSAAVFGVRGLIMTDRNSPALSGVLAKTACGGLEHVPVVLVTNLSRALDELGQRGYMRIGLDGEGEEVLGPKVRAAATLLVLGAEGSGLRRLTKENCDLLCKIPTSGAISSLNVSNAAAVALFALQDGLGEAS